MYPQLAKLIQDLIAGASVSASRQNTSQLVAIHNFLDGIQSNTLVVVPAIQKKEAAPE